MSKGINKLYNDLVIVSVTKHRRGRSVTFNEKRNECLIDRYLFYLNTTKWRFEAVLKCLSNDFFLSEVTIRNLLDQNYSQLCKFKKEYSSYSSIKLKSNLKKKWEQFTW